MPLPEESSFKVAAVHAPLWTKVAGVVQVAAA